MTQLDIIAEIKRLYYAATRATIQQDLERAIELLKRLPDEDERQRVAVYMDGLSQMRSEWSTGGPPQRPASARQNAGARGYSDRSKDSGRRGR